MVSDILGQSETSHSLSGSQVLWSLGQSVKLISPLVFEVFAVRLNRHLLVRPISIYFTAGFSLYLITKVFFYQVDARNGEKPIFGEIGNRMYARWPNGSPNTNTDTKEKKTIYNS